MTTESVPFQGTAHIGQLAVPASPSLRSPLPEGSRPLKTEHDYFVLTLERRVSDFYKKAKNAQKEPSSENLRKFRVAARRLSAGLSLIQKVSPCKGLNWTKSQISKKIRPLGELRDVQLFLNQVSSLTEASRDVRKYRAQLESRRRKLERKADAAISSLLSDKLASRLRSARVRMKRKTIDSLLLHRVHLAFADSFLKVERKRDKLRQSSPESYHDLRIAFKKYRYTAEILAPFYPRIVNETLDQMQLLQRKFGTLQDADALLKDMQKFVKKHPKHKALVKQAAKPLHENHQAAFDEIQSSCKASPLLKKPVYSSSGVFKLASPSAHAV